MRIRFLEQARYDLADINQYYRQVGGNALASTMLARIKTPILALKDHPQLAAAYELAPGIRRLVVANGAFLVFYRISSHIDILHIRRSERIPVSIDKLKQIPSPE